MAYAGGAKLVMFGGKGHREPPELGDTWEYDSATHTWAERNRDGVRPSPRWWQAMAYVGGTRIVMFSGTAHERFLDDTWEYDVQTHAWTKIDPGEARPAPRAGHAMAYLGGTKALLFGGWTTHQQYLTDTWEYDAAAKRWTRIDAKGKLPPMRGDFPMSYVADNRAVLFGGSHDGGKGHYDDTWEYDAAARTWTQIPIEKSKPTPRCDAAMAYAGNREVLLFGGWQDRDDAIFGDTWLYDSERRRWTRLPKRARRPTPRARYTHALARAGRTTIVLFGGNTRSSDTWEFDVTYRVWREYRHGTSETDF